MDLEASIAERLWKLKEWQEKQHEKLLKEQQIQREILSSEKDRLYKKLGLPIHDLNNIIENGEMEMDAIDTVFHDSSILKYDAKHLDGTLEVLEDCEREKYEEESEGEQREKKESEVLNHVPTIVDKNKNSVKRYNSSVLLPKEELSNNLLIEGIKPLSLDNVPVHSHVSIDDIPLPSPKKDFHTLLEEKLNKETELASNEHTDAMAKPKKPFLRKGQGLSRFKMSTRSHHPQIVKKYSTSLSLNKKNADKSNNCKSKKTVRKNIVSESPNNVSTVIGRQQLNLKAVPLPRKILNKSESIPCNEQVATSNRSKHLSELNMLDFESKTERELEEVRIFELLEEKAENSSFCSTSSTVLAFLQQSTPYKVKKMLNYSRSETGGVMTPKQQDNERKNDPAIPQELTVQRSAYIESLKSPHQVEQLDLPKRSRKSVATINSYWETIDNTRKETQEHLTSDNQDVSYNAPIIAELSSDSEEGDASAANDRNLARNNDASHHVRFSEYNEYRTIDLLDTSDATNKSPFEEELDQQDSDNGSFLSSETSDVGEKVPEDEDYEEQMSSLELIDNEKATDAARRLSLQQDVQDLFYRAMKSLSVSEEGNTSRCKNALPDKDTMYNDDVEEIVQSNLPSSCSSSSSSLSGSRQELSVHEKEAYTEKNILRNEKIEETNTREDRINSFEPELLKSRLLELEREIDIFRKESAALLLQRQKLQEQQAILRKEYLEKERNFEENRRRVQNQLEEEKKKLAREKVAMESRVRDAQEKARQNKIERQKAQDLQEQLENLRDELNVKESRWNAAESRYKSELRVLRVEISKLKQEVTNLQNVRRAKNVKNTKKSTNGQAISKAINQINKRVVASSKETSAKISRDLSDAPSSAFIRDGNDNIDDDDDKRRISRNKSAELKAIDTSDDFEQIEEKENASVNKVDSKQIGIGIEAQPKCSPTGKIAGKKNLYRKLLKDATSDLMEDRVKQDMNNPYQPIIAQLRHANASKSNEISGESSDKSCSSSASESLERATIDIARNVKGHTERSRDTSEDKDRDRMTEKNSTSHSPSLHQPSGTSPKDATRQIQHSDGRIEYWYPNGNVKKIFPDQGITKMIYYNGDVRETDKDGKVRYFYSTSRTWCTMTPDGVQIFEFSKYVRLA